MFSPLLYYNNTYTLRVAGLQVYASIPETPPKDLLKEVDSFVVNTRLPPFDFEAELENVPELEDESDELGTFDLQDEVTLGTIMEYVMEHLKHMPGIKSFL